MQIVEFKDLPPPDKYAPLVAVVIQSDQDAAYVGDQRKEIKDQLKEVERIRAYLKEPVLEQGRRIDAQAKTVSEPLVKIVSAIDAKLLEWAKSQEEIRIEEEKRKREEELARLEAERQAQASIAEAFGDDAAIKATQEIEKNVARLEAKPIEASSAVRSGYSTTFVQKRWKFKVVDPKAVPREFLVVDEVKLGKYATAMRETATVPGVMFYEEAAIGGR